MKGSRRGWHILGPEDVQLTPRSVQQEEVLLEIIADRTQQQGTVAEGGGLGTVDEGESVAKPDGAVPSGSTAGGKAQDSDMGQQDGMDLGSAKAMSGSAEGDVVLSGMTYDAQPGEEPEPQRRNMHGASSGSGIR